MLLRTLQKQSQNGYGEKREKAVGRGSREGRGVRSGLAAGRGRSRGGLLSGRGANRRRGRGRVAAGRVVGGSRGRGGGVGDADDGADDDDARSTPFFPVAHSKPSSSSSSAGVRDEGEGG